MGPSIVVTGEGIICAIGRTKSEVERSLREQHSGIGAMRYLNSVHKELPVGEVPYSNDEIRAMLSLEVSSRAGRTALMGMYAAEQALIDAGLFDHDGSYRDGSLTLVSGTTVGGMDATELHFQKMRDEGKYLDWLLTHDCGASTMLIADYLGCTSEYTTLSTACSSAANSILLGARMLKNGLADRVLVGGSEALSKFHLNGFRSLMILDSKHCRPFDATRSGLNLGEGAAYLVMETEEAALARGAKIHAYLTGYGNACDAFHQTASSPEAIGSTLAIGEALSVSGLRPEDIDYINAHGTATPDNDRAESLALNHIFKNHIPPISSTKGYTGHATSAAGGIEAVISILALQHHFIPANIGFKYPMENGIMPSLGESEIPLYNVLSNSFGFGGNDTALIFSSAPIPTRTIERNDKPIKVIGRAEICSESQLEELREWIKPMESRRMGKLMKSSLLASFKALKEAGITCPDAIITATKEGCLENSERFLVEMVDTNEQAMRPTDFMQSTHNTIGCHIAIRTQCHGYNVTYSQCDESLSWAIRDAEMLLHEGRVKYVLVGKHEETTPTWRQLMKNLSNEELLPIHSLAMVLTCGN